MGQGDRWGGIFFEFGYQTLVLHLSQHVRPVLMVCTGTGYYRFFNSFSVSNKISGLFPCVGGQDLRCILFIIYSRGAVLFEPAQVVDVVVLMEKKMSRRAGCAQVTVYTRSQVTSTSRLQLASQSWQGCICTVGGRIGWIVTRSGTSRRPGIPGTTTMC